MLLLGTITNRYCFFFFFFFYGNFKILYIFFLPLFPHNIAITFLAYPSSFLPLLSSLLSPLSPSPLLSLLLSSYSRWWIISQGHFATSLFRTLTDILSFVVLIVLLRKKTKQINTTNKHNKQ